MANVLSPSSLTLNNLSQPTTSGEGLNTPSTADSSLSPISPFSLLANPPSIVVPFVNKLSIHHQDAEVSIADANDCLRMVANKIEWFYRKYSFCPHLMTPDDIRQIDELMKKIWIEEVPFLELQNRLHTGQVVDIPKELVGRVGDICKEFSMVKNQINQLVANVVNLQQEMREP